MILIRSKEQYQNCSCQQQPQDQAFTVERLADLAADQVFALKPSSDFVGHSARVGSDEVAGSHSPSNVAGFGQVTAIIPSSGETGVPSGGDSREGDKASLLGSDFERPFGVDSLNVPKRDLDAPEQVIQNDAPVSDLDAGSPEQEKTAKPEPHRQQRTLEQTNHTELQAAEQQSQQQGRTKTNGQILTETGSKSHTAMTLRGK